jgi:hypothetical protein
MSRILGAILFAVGAIGMAVWLWFNRKRLALVAAKAMPGQASAAAKEQASALANAVPEQTSAVTNAAQKQPPSAR